MIFVALLIDNIRILGIPFSYGSFFSSFLEKVLDEDVHHVDALPRLRDNIWNPFLVFCSNAFLSILLFPLSFGFLNEFVVFDSTLLEVFDKLSGPSFFKCL